VSDDFDPYYQWLGIPPKHQPADHYRLLGVEQFEANTDVIGDAAERQIAHVRRSTTVAAALCRWADLSRPLRGKLDDQEWRKVALSSEVIRSLMRHAIVY